MRETLPPKPGAVPSIEPAVCPTPPLRYEAAASPMPDIVALGTLHAVMHGPSHKPFRSLATLQHQVPRAADAPFPLQGAAQ
jgi:hypothetical protein